MWEVGNNFSHTVVLSPPFGYVALSHLACLPMLLHSFVLQLPSPSHCVWCQLDKFSFFLSPFISNLCRTIMSTAISLSPSLTPVTATSTPRYLTNPVAATTATMPPLAPTLTCVAGHTQATPPPSLSLCVFFKFNFSYFSFHLELAQDSVGCNTAAAATSPCARTGYPVAVISPFWGMPAAPWHPPLRASRVHASHRCRSPYLVPPLKKKCKSFVPFTSNFPLAHTPRRLTKKTWLHKDI